MNQKLWREGKQSKTQKQYRIIWLTVSLCVFHRKSKLRIARRSLILPLFHFCMLKWHPTSSEQVLGKVSRAAVCRFILSFILMGIRRGGKCKKPECQQMWVHHCCQSWCWAGTASWVPAPEGSTPCGLPGRVVSCGVTPLPIAHTPASLLLFLAPRKHGRSNKYLEGWAHRKSGHFPRGQNNTFFPTSLLRNSTMLSMTLPKSFQRNLGNFCSKPVNVTSNWKQKLPVIPYGINFQSRLMWLLPHYVQVILTPLYYPKHVETKKR